MSDTAPSATPMDLSPKLSPVNHPTSPSLSLQRPPPPLETAPAVHPTPSLDPCSTSSKPSEEGENNNDKQPHRNTSPGTLQQVEIPASSGPPVPAEKPKSKAPKPKPPSPPPPPPPPPLITVRLTIPLGGPDHYAVSIRDLAKATGQRPPTPPVRRDSFSDSEPDDDANVEATVAATKKPTKTGLRRTSKRNDADGYYDLDDPFIDDSDLVVDAPTHFAQTKQKGFYVSSGEVALVKDSTKKPKKPRVTSTTAQKAKTKGTATKPASGRPSNRGTKTRTPSPRSQTPPRSASNGVDQVNGTRDNPIALLEDQEMIGTSPKRIKLDRASSHEAQGPKEGTPSGSDAPSKKRKRGDGEIQPFSQPVEDEFRKLKEAIALESFAVKTKFPMQLRPLLINCAVKAMEHNEYDENFFDYLPEILPYNRFTLQKLTRRLTYHQHRTILEQRQGRLLVKLQEEVDCGFPDAQRQHEEAMKQWKLRRERKQQQKDQEDPRVSASPSPEPSGKRERDALPPPQRYRWTEEMKQILWDLISITNESATITNLMHTYEAAIPTVSEQGMRKILYSKITACFPPGWITSTMISREVSAMKKKFEVKGTASQADEVEGDVEADDDE